MKPYHILKIAEYRGCPILVRQFPSMSYFEYVTVIGKQMYSSHLFATIPLLSRLLGKGYTEREIESSVRMVVTLAQTTIDTVLGTDKP